MGRKKNKDVKREVEVEVVFDATESKTPSNLGTAVPSVEPDVVSSIIETVPVTPMEIPWMNNTKCPTHNKYNCHRCYRRK